MNILIVSAIRVHESFILYAVKHVLNKVIVTQSIFNMIPADDQKNLPEDENTPEKRAAKIWEFFGKKENGNSKSIHSCFLKSLLYLHLLTFLFLCCLFLQIKSQRENSFRAWWTTRRSCGWYNTMSLRKSKTSSKRRSNNYNNRV